MASSYGNHDAACCARNFAAMALALSGADEESRATIERVLADARRLDDPFSLALTLYFTSAAAQMLGHVPLAAANAEQGLRLATEHGLAQPRAWNMMVAGWCTVENGAPDRGIDLLAQAVAAMQAIHSRHFMTYLLGLLADARLKAGRHAEAMATVEEGIALADTTGERFYSAELHRLRGEICARAPARDRHDPDTAFCAAIEIARQQGSVVLERKAVESRARWAEGRTERVCPPLMRRH
jgi:adenylate cyclase